MDEDLKVLFMQEISDIDGIKNIGLYLNVSYF